MITLRRPEDCHVHLRNAPMLGALLRHTHQFAPDFDAELPAVAQNRRGGADLGSATKHGLCVGEKIG